MSSVGVVAKRGDERASEVKGRLLSICDDLGFDAVSFPSTESLEEAREGGESLPDLLVVVGGDGTVLQSLHALDRRELPLMGIGVGRRNFLATTSSGSLQEDMRRVMDGEYSLDRVVRLDVEVEGEETTPVLNEAYLTSPVPGKVIRLVVALEKGGRWRRVWSDLSDGVVVASPVGSSAYSFSAGGPIVHTQSDSICVTPVAPIFLRGSMVLSGDSVVGLWSEGRSDVARLVLDGQRSLEVSRGDEVVVRRSEDDASFVTFERYPDVDQLVRSYRVEPAT